MSYSVTIHGFKTKKAAECFYNWFEGQGEQDLSYAWEIVFSSPSPTTDMNIPPRWIGTNYEFYIKGT